MSVTRMAQCSCPGSSLAVGPPKAWPSLDLTCVIAGGKPTTVVPFSAQAAHSMVFVILVAVGVIMAWWLFFIFVQLRCLRHIWDRVQQFFSNRGQARTVREMKALELCAQRRSQRQTAFLRVLAITLPPFLCFSWLIALFDSWSSPDFTASMYSNIFESSVSIVTCVAVISLCFSSLKMKVRAADYVMALLYLTLGVWPTFSENDYYFLWGNRGIQCAQIVVGLMISRTRGVIPPMVLNCIWQSFLILDAPPLRANAVYHFSGLFMVQCAVVGVSLSSETWLMSEAMALVGEMEASRSEKIAHGLLGVMCDAVVPLSQDLKLREPCPRLAAILVSGNAQNNVGQPFTRFLSKRDQPRFDEFIEQQEREEPGAAGSLHVNLVDSMGGTVKVQLFHTSWPGLDGGPTHLIGVLEDKDQEAYMSGALSSPTRQTAAHRHPEGGFLEKAAHTEGEVQAAGSDGSSHASSRRRARIPTVTVAPESPFKVLEVSPAVGKLFGYISTHNKSTALSTWLEEPEPFVAFLSEGVAAVNDSGESMWASFGPTLVRPNGDPEVRKKLVTLLVTITCRPAGPPSVVIEMRRVKAAAKSSKVLPVGGGFSLRPAGAMVETQGHSSLAMPGLSTDDSLLKGQGSSDESSMTQSMTISAIPDETNGTSRNVVRFRNM